MKPKSIIIKQPKTFNNGDSQGEIEIKTGIVRYRLNKDCLKYVKSESQKISRLLKNGV